MFSDTLIVTIDAVDKTLTRINQDGYSSEYLLKEDTGDFRLRLRNSSYKSADGQKTDRHNAELIQTVYVTDGPNLVRKSYIVFENSEGDPLLDVKDCVTGFVSFVDDAAITKLLNWES